MKGKTKSPKGSRSRPQNQKATRRPKKAVARIEEALKVDDPMAALTHEEFVFVKAMVSGKSAVQSLRDAKPEWNDATINSNAYLWKRNPVIVRAWAHLMKKIAEDRESGAISERNEALALVTTIMRTTLAEVDQHHPACKKMVTRHLKGDIIETTVEMHSVLDAAKVILDDKSTGSKGGFNILVLGGIVNAGVPQESGGFEHLLDD